MALSPFAPENLSRDCIQTAGVAKLTKAAMEGMSLPRLQAIAACDDLRLRERRTVEALVAERPLRAWCLTGGIGPRPTQN